MYQILLVFFFLNQLIINIAAAPPKFHSLYGANTLPTCFPTQPHCIRPRVDECRDALSIMVKADPGYPVILGRPGVVGDGPRAYGVPRAWSSLPYNCVVKLDVTDPRAVEEVFLMTLTAPAELVIRNCIIGGTGCGGSILVGRNEGLKLTLAYYNGVRGKGVVLDIGRVNGSRHALVDE